MDSSKYLMIALENFRFEKSLLGPTIRAVRDNREDDSHGGKYRRSVVIWRLDASERETTLDGSGPCQLCYFEISCRVEVGADNDTGEPCRQAQMIGNDILSYLDSPWYGDIGGRHYLPSRLEQIVAQYDEPDDESQKKGDYISHILEIGLSATGGDLPLTTGEDFPYA